MSDDFLGFNFRIVAAGFSGGVVGAYFAYLKKHETWQVVMSVVIGGLAANYFAPPISLMIGGLAEHYLSYRISSMIGTPDLTTAFVVGMTWKELCMYCIARVGKALKE